MLHSARLAVNQSGADAVDSVMDRNPVQPPFFHRGEPELSGVVRGSSCLTAQCNISLSEEMESTAESLQPLSSRLVFLLCNPSERDSIW